MVPSPEVTLSAYVARGVRAERSRTGLTQVELAQLINEAQRDTTATAWTNTTVHELETGKRGIKLDDVPLLCQALGVTLYKLAQDADPRDLAALGIG
jgi:transcriptional regulator with XRE-family HTH domain